MSGRASLAFAPFLPFIDTYGPSMAGFVAGSILLLVPGRWRWAGYSAVITAATVLWVVVPEHGYTAAERAAVPNIGYTVAAVGGPGLLVYGLSWLTGLARQHEELQDELAQMAVSAERLRVARDVHDLLGLGLAAAALKADLIGRLIGRDDARAIAEIDEVGRVCAAARAELRRVTGDGQLLSLTVELAAARQILAAGGVEVDTRVTGQPLPSAADAVLAVVLREAVTNVLRHAAALACTIRLTAQDGTVRLQISNDGVADLSAASQPGSGLANLAARVAAAGGNLTSCRSDGRFDLVAEIPLPGHAGRQDAQASSAASPS